MLFKLPIFFIPHFNAPINALRWQKGCQKESNPEESSCVKFLWTIFPSIIQMFIALPLFFLAFEEFFFVAECAGQEEEPSSSSRNIPDLNQPTPRAQLESLVRDQLRHFCEHELKPFQRPSNEAEMLEIYTVAASHIIKNLEIDSDEEFLEWFDALKKNPKTLATLYEEYKPSKKEKKVADCY